MCLKIKNCCLKTENGCLKTLTKHPLKFPNLHYPFFLLLDFLVSNFIGYWLSDYATISKYNTSNIVEQIKFVMKK